MAEIKEKNSRKGLFFTVSIIFLLPAVITLWTLSMQQTNTDETIIIDRVQELSGSVKSSIRELFDHFYDCKILIERDEMHVNVTFIDKISRSKDEWGSEFNSIIENFRNFVVSEEPHIWINLTGLQEKEIPFIIEPYNVTYSRYWGIGHIVIRVVPETMNFQSYDLVINSTVLEIKNISTTFRDPGGFHFSITSVDDYGHREVRSANIDPSANHQVQIFFDAGNKVKIDLISNVLEIWTNAPNTTIVNTKIDNFNVTDERITIAVFRNIINVSFPEFRAEKIDSVSISDEA
ncbi:hypothetical protein JXC34_07385 [Candidatus Woesearchaeota archaeon]|nr:hypothetical protein [Candidatus Woesearchaeota archaeon]